MSGKFNLGDTLPNLEVDTSCGKLKLHEYIGEGNWAILFSHPRDYTPVCTTELARAAQLSGEFEKRKVRMIALSCDSVEDHVGWKKDIEDFAKCSVKYPIISDLDRSIAKRLGMIDADETDLKGMPVTCRACFVIGPDKKLKLSILYPATTGRNFDEILRVIDSLQLTACKKVATPCNWKEGDKCMVVPTLSDEEARKLFDAGFDKVAVPSGKEYIRLTPHPK